MTITIKSNIPSLIAQRRLSENTQAISTLSERLSSGMRINRASDDAAGLSIASTLEAEVRVYTKAIRNISDGVSALSIAEGALSQLSTIVTRQMELAEQAANGTYSLTQRKALHSEASALTAEYDRIIQTTSFNDISLLSDSAGFRLQLGYGEEESLQVNLASEFARNVGTGQYSSSTLSAVATHRAITTADLNNDGFLDLITQGGGSTSGSVLLGNGDGTFRAAATIISGSGNTGGVNTVIAQDFNGDGILDLIANNQDEGVVSILIGNGNGTFQGRTTIALPDVNERMVAGDINGDGLVDIVGGGFTLISNGDGTFAVGSYASSQNGIALADFNGDGKLDVVTSYSNTVSVLLNNGSGQFSTRGTYAAAGTSHWMLTTADVNNDGIVDIITNDSNVSGNYSILIGNGDGSFKAQITDTGVVGGFSLQASDMNGDGHVDLIFHANNSTGLVTKFGNGDGTFQASVTSASTALSYGMAIGDFNRDGVKDLAFATTGGVIELQIGQGIKSTKAEHLYLLSTSGAREALETTRKTLERINLEIGSIGAQMSRLQTASNNLYVQNENMSSARSRITDIDVAETSAQYTAKQILQQVVGNVLAQANLQPRLALKLLQA